MDCQTQRTLELTQEMIALVTTTSLMTVEELRRLPESETPFCELRHGELVKVTPPKFKHRFIQNRLVDLLRPLAPAGGYVSMELDFRALPEHELRTADVAFVTKERFEAIDPEDNLHGAPDLVIEVLSPVEHGGGDERERETLPGKRLPGILGR